MQYLKAVVDLGICNNQFLFFKLLCWSSVKTTQKCRFAFQSLYYEMKKAEKPLALKSRQKPSREKFTNKNAGRKKSNDKSAALVCVVHQSWLNTSKSEITPLSEKNFRIIKESTCVRQTRQSTPNDRQDEVCSSLPHEFDSSRHGYHRQCYQRFTDVSRLLGKKRMANDLSLDLLVKRDADQS